MENNGLCILWDRVDKVDLDLVFIHGLGGDRISSWTKNGLCWPRDLLPNELPNARMISWGYDFASGLQHDSRQNPISIHANLLLHHLEALRYDSKVETRPIIFIGHNLGGLIIKEMLMMSEQLSKCTRGIAFFGTPHRDSSNKNLGSILDVIASMAGHKPNNALIGRLYYPAEELQHLQDSFNKLSATYEYQLVTFYEEVPTSFGIVGSPSSFFVVPRESTVLHAQGENVIGIPSNHMEMCRFSSEHDIGYKRVSDGILSMASKMASTGRANPSIQSVPRAAEEQVEDRAIESSTAPQEGNSWLLHLPSCPGKGDAKLQADDIGRALAETSRDESAALHGLISSLPTVVSQLLRCKERFPAVAKLEDTLVQLKEWADLNDLPEDMHSLLSDVIPIISRVTHALVEDVPDRSEETLPRDSSARDALQQLRGILVSMSSIWDVLFVADLNGFCYFLNDRIDSVLTFTGSPKDAFAITAAGYVSWHWHQKGVDILKWLSNVFSAIKAGESAHPLRLQEEDQDSNPICLELHGQRYSKISSHCNIAVRVRWVQGGVEGYQGLVAEIASQLAWTVAAFKEPKQSLSFTRASIRGPFTTKAVSVLDYNCHASFQVVQEDMAPNEYPGMCWHSLCDGMNVAVDFLIPSRPERMRGLELPLSVMATFAGVDYPVRYKGGYVLKGWQTALFPVAAEPTSDLSATPNALQWHLFGDTHGLFNTPPENTGKLEFTRLYMEDVEKKEPSLCPIETGLPDTKFCETIEETARHFLGLYENARIRIGTNNSRNDVIKAAPHDKQVDTRILRWAFEWARQLGISAAGGSHAPLAVSTSWRMRTLTERQYRVEETAQSIHAQIVGRSASQAAILYDARNRTAWMLPRMCVIMGLVQAWARKYRPGTPATYPDFNNMDQGALVAAIDAFPGPQVNGNASRELREVFGEFARTLDRLEDEKDLEPSKSAHQLAGLDFDCLADLPRTYALRRVTINKESHGGWLQMLKRNWNDMNGERQRLPYRVVTLFCERLPNQPIHIVSDGTPVCRKWNPPPAGHDYLIASMHCLRVLVDIHRDGPVELAQDYFWKRDDDLPFERCRGSVCNRLQKIVHDSRRRQESDRDLSQLFRQPGGCCHAAIIFGACLESSRCMLGAPVD